MTLRAITGSSTLFEHLIGGREQGWRQVMPSTLAVVEGVNGRQTRPAPIHQVFFAPKGCA
jgi:hypothetical protein